MGGIELTQLKHSTHFAFKANYPTHTHDNWMNINSQIRKRIPIFNQYVTWRFKEAAIFMLGYISTTQTTLCATHTFHYVCTYVRIYTAIRTYFGRQQVQFVLFQVEHSQLLQTTDRRRQTLHTRNTNMTIVTTHQNTSCEHSFNGKKLNRPRATQRRNGELTFSMLLLSIRTSSFSRRSMSSGILDSWFVPRFSSTMFTHVLVSVRTHAYSHACTHTHQTVS